MIEKEKKGFVYKPRIMKQEDMEQGFRRATKSLHREEPQQEKREIPNFWRTQSMIKTRQENLDTFGMEPKLKKEEIKEEEPRWSAEEWEEWASLLLSEYLGQEMRPEQMLPDWFVEQWGK